MNAKFAAIEMIEECDDSDVYDIEVADNHNFFANDMLIHNCVGGYPTAKILGTLAAGGTHDQVQRELDNVADRFVDAVGRENFNWEIQFNSLPVQHVTNEHLMVNAARNGIPLVATADSHYPRPDLWEARELYKRLSRMSFKKGGAAEVHQLPKFEELKCELYPKNAAQMWDEYQKHKPAHPFYEGRDQQVVDAIERTHDLAWHHCDQVGIDPRQKLPNFNTPTKSAHDQLRDLAYEALRKEGKADDPVYVQRLEKELGDIKSKDFDAYFLTLNKIFEKASQRIIIGPARGSGGGCLVNYLLGITQLDPIKYDLLFERFLNVGRGGAPDVDTDASDRDVLIDCAKEVFGEDSVIPVSNFNLLKLKSLVKDISKFYDVDFREVNEVTGPLQDEVMPLAKKEDEEKSIFVLKHDDCMQYSERYRTFMEAHPDVLRHVETLFMQNRSVGIHAGGVLIYPGIEKFMPLIGVRGQLQTPWTEGMNFRNLESNQFWKFDFLGLTLLKMVEDCIRRILVKQGNPNPTFLDVKRFFDDNLNCRTNDPNDPKVYEHVYHAGRFPSVFQFTESGAREFCLQVKPDNIDEVAAITAIYRPGPLKANVHRLFAEAKQTGKPRTYGHPLINEILGPTLGFIVFQEQAMLLAHRLCGFSLSETDKMRKTLVKKSLDTNDTKAGELVKLQKDFVEGAVRVSGVDKKVAEDLFEDIRGFSLYAFNRCLTREEKVIIQDECGTQILTTVENVTPGSLIRSRDESTGEDVLTKIVNVHDHGEQEVFEVTLITGESVTCTMDHKFRTTDGRMLPLKQILLEDLSIVAKDAAGSLTTLHS